MKLLEIYNSLIEELDFQTFENENRLTISAMDGRENMGNVTLEFISNGGYTYFENEMDEEDYNELFPDDRFVMVDRLEVFDKYRGKGYAKLLMTKAIEIAKSRGERVMYLNASPLGGKGLKLDDLVGFYESFGFRVIPQSDHWTQNKEMIKYLAK